MKKTTYALIAVLAIMLAGIFTCLLILSHHRTNRKGYMPVAVAGTTVTDRTPQFNKIVIETSGYAEFYDNETEYSSADNLFKIICNDSVQAPSVTMSDGWKKFLSYSVSDSTLTLTFKEDCGDIAVGSSYITVMTPTLCELTVDDGVPVSLTRSTIGVLNAKINNELNFDSCKVAKVNFTCTNKYSYVNIDAAETEIDSLNVYNVDDISISADGRIRQTTLYGRPAISTHRANLYGTGLIDVSTVPASDEHSFELVFYGNRSFHLND